MCIGTVWGLILYLTCISYLSNTQTHERENVFYLCLRFNFISSEREY